MGKNMPDDPYTEDKTFDINDLNLFARKKWSDAGGVPKVVDAMTSSINVIVDGMLRTLCVSKDVQEAMYNLGLQCSQKPVRFTAGVHQDGKVYRLYYLTYS